MVAGTAMTLPVLPWGWEQMTAASPEAWLAAGYLGVLPSALGFVLWGYAVARLPVATSTSLLYLVPPVAVLIAWGWLGQLPTITELLGGLVVIAGVVIIALGDRVMGRLRDSWSVGRASASTHGHPSRGDKTGKDGRSRMAGRVEQIGRHRRASLDGQLPAHADPRGRLLGALKRAVSTSRIPVQMTSTSQSMKQSFL
jgi:hypothetical protein